MVPGAGQRPRHGHAAAAAEIEHVRGGRQDAQQLLQPRPVPAGAGVIGAVSVGQRVIPPPDELGLVGVLARAVGGTRRISVHPCHASAPAGTVKLYLAAHRSAGHPAEAAMITWLLTGLMQLGGHLAGWASARLARRMSAGTALADGRAADAPGGIRRNPAVAGAVPGEMGTAPRGNERRLRVLRAR